MLSLNAIPSLSAVSAQALFSSPCFHFFPRNPRTSCCSRVCRAFGVYSGYPDDSSSGEREECVAGLTSNYAGLRLEETVDIEAGKLRLDSWISSRISGVSRARVQSSIRFGLVSVNGRVVDKVSHAVRPGDKVKCTVSELQPLRAEAEDIPLDIVYEDDCVLVVNKPPHMVVHPAPGNATGTLVNGILHHCSLPTVAYSDKEVLCEAGDISDNELSDFSIDQVGISYSTLGGSVRPGIVHRLDKGTSGLLVVAKNEHSHAHLCEQFKLRTIHRVYVSLTSGVPSPTSGRVDIPIGRDLSNRIRMTAASGSSNCGQARHAASRYKVIETLAGGGSALVEWRLETGRTHQIRAHAKYLGIPLLGDEVYGGSKSMALSLLQPRTPPSCNDLLLQLVSRLERPCLHAVALGKEAALNSNNILYGGKHIKEMWKPFSCVANLELHMIFFVEQATSLSPKNFVPRPWWIITLLLTS